MFTIPATRTRPILPAITLALLALCWSTFAAAPADPYADAVDATTSPLVANPTHAVGAPDGILASVVSAANSPLVLDLGSDEEGTGDLIVHYSGVPTALATTVSFLDASKNTIATGTLNLASTGSAAYTAVVPYSQAPTPYRYVHFASLLLSQYAIDAVEAATYRPDSDGDGLPDTWELTYGLDPLDATGDNGANGDPDGDGLTNAQELAAGSNPQVFTAPTNTPTATATNTPTNTPAAATTSAPTTTAATNTPTTSSISTPTATAANVPTATVTATPEIANQDPQPVFLPLVRR